MMTAQERAEWLQARRRGIGSSDIAAICGISHFRTPQEIYLDKLGLLPERDNAAMFWGRRLEAVIAEAYAEQQRTTLHQPPMVQHPREPFALASADRMTDDGVIVECKASRSHDGWGEPWTDQAPEEYLLQAHWQMEVYGLREAHIAVLFGGQEFCIYSVPHSPILSCKLLVIGADFWGRVQNQDPPPIDWQDPRVPELVPLLYQPDPTKLVELSAADLDLVRDYETAAARLASANEQAASAKAEKDLYRARLIERMGTAATAVLPDGRTISRKEVVCPERIQKAYSYFNFKVLKPKKAKVRE